MPPREPAGWPDRHLYDGSLGSRQEGSTRQEQEGASAMRTQQQITKRTTRPVTAPLDLRSPTGRPLPF